MVGRRARQAHPELVHERDPVALLKIAASDPEVRSMMEKRIQEAAAKRRSGDSHD
jgi:hypothetical protein